MCEDHAYNSLANKPLQPIKEVVTVETMQLDKFIEENNISRVDVIKCDTEGAEYLVFKGSDNILRKYKPKLFFEYNPFVKGFMHKHDDVFLLLKKYGYEFYEFRNHTLCKVENFNFQTNDIYAE
ncbi:FkbM family methyltransferase [Tenuifilum thalassicum]|uniref:FkbM family methyltransferase n=1 Tax=Tenuifilum thalassicum TaxID=2590900 RepID=A0A7D4BCR2_9BACT|nr:FkbM family methyltransferase [Tenuifilum thalassicum]